MKNVKIQQWLIGIFSVLLIGSLMIVASVEIKRTSGDSHEIDVDEISARCIKCHEKENIAVKQVHAWEESMHALKGIGCYECHEAQKDDFDAFYCESSDLLVARHPTPKDCSECHEKEVAEFANSKHAHQFWLFANADRATFEMPIATRHGCEECHQIGNLWPDGSVGECDACHSKHSFSMEVARQPETCGECHIGPDHPHIEIYNESKHGNIFKARGKHWDMNYNTTNNEEIPFEAPVCVTCHMDGNETQPMTHDVSARLAWESQAPWSYRTVWDEENLGSWDVKRGRMEAICNSCHAPDFVDVYFLTADLVNLQYNEIRREFVYWTQKLTADGTIDRLEKDGKFYSNPVISGWDEKPEELMYYAWHHEGRRFRHGALMMGADFTQWHGIWEIQEDMVELITWAAEHGDHEAEKWVNSNDPAKFRPYALYDIPGNEWGINAKANTTPFVYNNHPDYWERVYKNVKKAYDEGLLTRDQWNLWLNRYENKDHFLGLKYTNDAKVDSTWNFYKDRNAIDKEAFIKQAVKLDLPGKSFYDDK
ncbi:MAG: cytochrome C [Candidatus Marinimicrobia bacterium]|nr:cytochrome C [Candidatus Neomarinimicrobiota bacterium]MBL7109596.1 cytochrome C [Candidatus Neomarinimicrobiota bacterium]